MKALPAARLGLWIAVAVGASLVAPGVRPLDPSVRPLADALTFGCLAGGGGCLLLACRSIPGSAFSA